jgi:predicted outer membrane repeat protein
LCILADYAELRLHRCQFFGNTAKSGGAIYISGSYSQAYITDTTFEDNVAVEYGGAIFAKSVHFQWYVSFSTFHNNSAERNISFKHY